MREVPPYGLRHCFGTAVGAAGTNESIIGQLMGHTKLQTTSRYIACNDEAHKKAVGSMEKKVREVMAQVGGNGGSAAQSDAATW